MLLFISPGKFCQIGENGWKEERGHLNHTKRACIATAYTNNSDAGVSLNELMQTKLSGVGACDKRRGHRRMGIGIFGKDVHRKNRQRRLYTTTTTATTTKTTIKQQQNNNNDNNWKIELLNWINYEKNRWNDFFNVILFHALLWFKIIFVFFFPQGNSFHRRV